MKMVVCDSDDSEQKVVFIPFIYTFHKWASELAEEFQFSCRHDVFYKVIRAVKPNFNRIRIIDSYDVEDQLYEDLGGNSVSGVRNS